MAGFDPSTEDQQLRNQHRVLWTQLNELLADIEKWDEALPADDTGDPCNSSRFTCVLGGQAVRDNETGLVWERSPDPGLRTWSQSISHCLTREVADRFGWYLPQAEQLASLLDLNVAPAPTVPNGVCVVKPIRTAEPVFEERLPAGYAFCFRVDSPAYVVPVSSV